MKKKNDGKASAQPAEQPTWGVEVSPKSRSSQMEINVEWIQQQQKLSASEKEEVSEPNERQTAYSTETASSTGFSASTHLLPPHHAEDSISSATSRQSFSSTRLWQLQFVKRTNTRGEEKVYSVWGLKRCLGKLEKQAELSF